MMTTTNANQFEMLISFMEKNEGIAKNYLNAPQYKETTNKLWNDLMLELNNEGPPSKNVAGWKKVWQDFKYTVKNKLRENKKSHSGTGGGPCKIKRLSPLEERVDKILDLSGEIQGIDARDFCCEVEPTETIEIMEILNTNPETHPQIPIPPTISTNTRRESNNTTEYRKKPKETGKMLLKQQLKMQEEFYKKCEQYQTNKLKVLKEIRNSNKDLLKCKRETLSFNKEKWLSKKKLLIEKNKMKAEQLELQKMEVELKRY